MQLQVIKNKIFTIRDQKVMFDFDLAELYGVETRALKQSVRRNIDRFPEDFVYQLTKQEWNEVITICDNLPEGVKFSPSTPFVFTEQGVAMLSSVLRSNAAIAINISIMRAFVLMRHYALSHSDLTAKLKELEEKYDRQFADIHEALNYLLQKDKQEIEFKERRRIGFNV